MFVIDFYILLNSYKYSPHTLKMGGKESKEPVAKYGLLKHYVGNDIVYQPVAAPDGSLLQPRNSTLIFLHDHGENP